MPQPAHTIRLAETDPRSVDPQDLAAAIRDHANGAARALSSSVSMKGVGGQPDWATVETEIWRVGEAVRKYLRARRECRGQGPVADALEELARDDALGKGRGNLVDVLATYGGDTYTGALVDLLLDGEVAAAAVQALLRKQDARFVAQVQAAAELAPEHPALRRYSRRYLRLHGRDAS